MTSIDRFNYLKSALTDTPGFNLSVKYHYNVSKSPWYHDNPVSRLSEDEYREVMLGLGFRYSDDTEQYWKDIDFTELVCRIRHPLDSEPTFLNQNELQLPACTITGRECENHPYRPIGLTGVKLVSNCDRVDRVTILIGGIPFKSLRRPWFQFVDGRELEFFGPGAIIPVPQYHNIHFEVRYTDGNRPSDSQNQLTYDLVDLTDYVNEIKGLTADPPSTQNEERTWDGSEYFFDEYLYECELTRSSTGSYRVYIAGPDRYIKIRFTGGEGVLPDSVSCEGRTFERLEDGEFQLPTGDLFNQNVVRVSGGDYEYVHIVLVRRNILRLMAGMGGKTWTV